MSEKHESRVLVAFLCLYVSTLMSVVHIRYKLQKSIKKHVKYMFQVLSHKFSVWLLFLINKYAFKSKLFHFILDTICTRYFVHCIPLVYHCAK